MMLLKILIHQIATVMVSKNSDLSDSESNDASDLPVSENADEGQPSSNQRDTLSSRAGIT